MAFGLERHELKHWQQKVMAGEIAIITHYWLDDRFPGSTSVTKVGCSDIKKLVEWGKNYQLKPEWIDNRSKYIHYDLFGGIQYHVLEQEGLQDQIERFNLSPNAQFFE